mmetsp:Transcript_3615/g.14107  ORF Transcript_3615/g.14107 Transcript_3615/m.14107 type:complete len:256 (+) Transcript_3615:322-1089(+)
MLLEGEGVGIESSSSFSGAPRGPPRRTTSGGGDTGGRVSSAAASMTPYCSPRWRAARSRSPRPTVALTRSTRTARSSSLLRGERCCCCCSRRSFNRRRAAMSSICGPKPRSRSRSTSSRTTHSRRRHASCEASAAVESRWSSNRPGVAHRITSPLRRRAFSDLRRSPPVTAPATMPTSKSLPTRVATPQICAHSSRVGATHAHAIPSARVRPRRESSTGRTYASVFPLPVGATTKNDDDDDPAVVVPARTAPRSE